MSYCSPSPTPDSKDELLDSCPDDDFAFSDMYTNAGKHLMDFKRKLKVDFQDMEKQDDSLKLSSDSDSEIAPLVNKEMKRLNKKTKRLKTNGVTKKQASLVNVPFPTVEAHQIVDIPEQGGRQTRSHQKGHQVRKCSVDPVLQKGKHKTPKDTLLLPRTSSKIFSRPTIVLSDESDSDDEISFVAEEDPNWEVSVKVCWKFRDIHKFKIRKFQKLTSIFEYFSKLENVSENQIQLVLNDNFILPSDTPDSVKLCITNIIDGGVVEREVTNTNTMPQSQPCIEKDSIQLKVCTKNRKEPMFVTLKKTDKMAVLMSKISEQMEVGQDNLKFLFDGDVLNPSETSIDLDLEGGEMIDLRVANM